MSSMLVRSCYGVVRPAMASATRCVSTLPVLPSSKDAAATKQEKGLAGKLSGADVTHLARKATIRRQAKSAATSATHKSKSYVLSFPVEKRWQNHVMGWSSNGDPLSNTRMTFPDAESALRFAQNQGWDVEDADEFHESKSQEGIKSYSHNFLSERAEYHIAQSSNKGATAKKIFKWQNERSAAWVNLERTHWDDEKAWAGIGYSRQPGKK
jgi:hypothetical protein